MTQLEKRQPKVLRSLRNDRTCNLAKWTGGSESAVMLIAFMWFAITLLVAAPSIANDGDANPPLKTAPKSELVWKNGDRLPGRPVSFNENKLTFQSQLFQRPLEISTDWLRSFETNNKSTKAKQSNERFAIQLIDGQTILADVKSLDEDILKVESNRAGQFEIDRTRLSSIVNRAASETLASGAIDLDLWDAKRGDKRYWKRNQNGEVVATRDDIHLFFKSKLPDSCLVAVEVAWDEELDFVLALQIPHSAKNIGNCPRLESWGSSIVFNNDDDFEVVIAELDEDVKSLKLLVHWDQKSNKVVIHDELGAKLASTKIEKVNSRAQSGIYLQNKSGDFRIKSLDIRGAAAGFDPSSTSVQLKSKEAINATIESFDGTTWKATPSAKTTSKEKFNHILISESGKLRGRLESGSPTDDHVLFWRVTGASQAVPFASAFLGDDSVNAKVILEKNDKAADVENDWPDTLYLNNRDLLPVRFRSANENQIVVDSFFENRIIPDVEVRAVEFGAKGRVFDLKFSDPSWRKSGGAKLSGENFNLKKNGTIGHADLMGRGGFEFELDWPGGAYGVLKIQFGRSLKENGQLETKNSQTFSILLYAQQYAVTSDVNVQNAATNLKQRGGKSVRFKVAIEKNQLVVYGDGKKCMNEKIKEGFGRSVSFQISDTFGMQASCDIENLKLADGFLSGEYIDGKRKELILTIPRLKARNPPGQILCATNFDLTRGNIVSINDDHVMFRTNGSVNRYSRNVLGSIVWIDTEALVKSLAAQETDIAADDEDPSAANEDLAASKPKQQLVPNEDKRQIAQVIMGGGRRVTLTLKRWEEDKLIGRSVLLGSCEIPFEQIYEIRMGKFATEATDVPWSDWTAKMAPQPKLDSGGGAGQDDSSIFGGDSPLIGQSPKLTLSMLDGKKLKLESIKGKVVVLDFWATWCGPCVKSLPGIKKVIDSYPDSSVSLITINQNESKQKIKSFLEKRKLDLKVALDDGEISEKFNVEAIPQTVVIGPEGKIQFVKVGASNDMEKKLRVAIDSLLDAAPE